MSSGTKASRTRRSTLYDARGSGRVLVVGLRPTGMKDICFYKSMYVDTVPSPPRRTPEATNAALVKAAQAVARGVGGSVVAATRADAAELGLPLRLEGTNRPAVVVAVRAYSGVNISRAISRLGGVQSGLHVVVGQAGAETVAVLETMATSVRVQEAFT